jgi:ribulose-phosphate 3-epimerase
VNVSIAPSLLSADFRSLASEVESVERGGADLLHLDVMDGHFVPNITFGALVVRAVHKVATVPLDVHLMIEEPDRYLQDFVDAGAARIAVHCEVLPHLHRTLQVIRKLGALAGVAINPSTPVDAIEEVAGDLDYVLVMSVNPGFGGQAFIPSAIEKISRLRALAGGRPIDIEIDGGITPENAARVAQAGANVLVAGSAVFKGGGVDSYRANIAAIRNAAALARGEAA